MNSSKNRDENGHTSFHVACSNGSTDIVELIIKKSIDLNIDLNAKYRTWGWTGLFCSQDPTINFETTKSKVLQVFLISHFLFFW